MLSIGLIGPGNMYFPDVKSMIRLYTNKFKRDHFPDLSIVHPHWTTFHILDNLGFGKQCEEIAVQEGYRICKYRNPRYFLRCTDEVDLFMVVHRPTNKEDDPIRRMMAILRADNKDVREYTMKSVAILPAR